MEHYDLLLDLLILFGFATLIAVILRRARQSANGGRYNFYPLGADETSFVRRLHFQPHTVLLSAASSASYKNCNFMVRNVPFAPCGGFRGA